MIWKRLLRNRLSLLGVVLAVLILVLITIGPLVWRVDPGDADLLNRLAPASGEHPFGTDTQGRDMLARLLNGGRVSVAIAFVTVAIASSVGGTLGLLAGYRRGWVEAIIMRLMDILQSFPHILMALTIAAARGPGVVNTIMAVTVPSIPGFARLTRSKVLSVRERDYVLAARASGVRPRRIMTRHVLRNSVGPLIVAGSINLGIVLLLVAGLGYLGLGVQPPTPEWGAILTDSQTYLRQRPLAILAPGVLISMTILAFNLLGDALRDVLDPEWS